MEHPETTELTQGHAKARRTLEINHNIKSFTEDDIMRMTNNYSTPIGKGGFGEVYKGVLDDDFDLVAVKRYIRGDLIEEFMEEVSIHSQINHKNVVKLIGYCLGESTLTLVTEYVSKGNLEDTLHNSDNSIPLDIRLGIAIGCAEALRFMHSMHLSSDSLVCHGDIKPANILLDYSTAAKVSDFGLSRLLSGGMTRYTMNVKGSIDYMDPIYLQKGRLTPRSDVYSFGIVLLELITRRRVKEGRFNLIETFSNAFAKGKGLRQLFDGEIANGSNMKTLEAIGKLATECLTLDIDRRPHINDLSERLLVLRKVHKVGTSRRFFRGSQNAWQKDFKQSTSIFGSNSMLQLKKGLGIFKGNSGSNVMFRELIGNVRVFSKEDLKEVTQNYSHFVGVSWLSMVYNGTLEDNSKVMVKIFDGRYGRSKHEFTNEGIILSQISHKNIIKLLGCYFKDNLPILIHEHTAKGNLSRILHGSDTRHGKEEFPLELRMKIAIKTAEALEYLHSSETGTILHGSVLPSNILLDDNFMPKLTDFSLSMKLITNDNHHNMYHFVTSNMFWSYIDPTIQTHGLSVKNDVYNFGIILLELISRKKPIQRNSEGCIHFRDAYQTYDSGTAMFDKDITAEEDIIVLDGIRLLALQCTILHVDGRRPTMKEVAERLRMIMRSWKQRTGATIHM